MKNRTMKLVMAALAMVAGVIYLLNPGAGVFELIPDNLPLIGNFDEAAAVALLFWGGSQFFGNEEDATPDIADMTSKVRQQHPPKQQGTVIDMEVR